MTTGNKPAKKDRLEHHPESAGNRHAPLGFRGAQIIVDKVTGATGMAAGDENRFGVEEFDGGTGFQCAKMVVVDKVWNTL